MVDVTDYQAADVAVGKRLSALLAWRPLESWQTVLAAGVAVLMAAALSLVLTGKDPASAATFITSVTRGEVVYADGTVMPATIGARLPGGASLRTGDAGGARITTDGRDVYIGALSTVTVVDGVHQTLERGLVMIDANSGPGLTLATSVGAGTVNAPAGALARVEQNVGTLRLAVYRAEASITAEGRRATTRVGALHQVRVPYGGVPEAPPPWRSPSRTACTTRGSSGWPPTSCRPTSTSTASRSASTAATGWSCSAPAPRLAAGRPRCRASAASRP